MSESSFSVNYFTIGTLCRIQFFYWFCPKLDFLFKCWLQKELLLFLEVRNLSHLVFLKMSIKYTNFMSQRSSHNLSPKVKSSSIRKILTSSFISKSWVKVLLWESHLTSAWRSKDVCGHPTSSHNILNSLIFLGDLINLIIFTLSSKTSFREGSIFFTARAWRWRMQWLLLHSLTFCFILEITPDVFPVTAFMLSVHTSTQLSHGMPLTVKNSSLIWKFQHHLR